MSKEHRYKLTHKGKNILKTLKPTKTSKGFVERLFKKIDELETELKNFKAVNKIIQYQLDRAINDLWRKDMRIKEMENGRSNDSD